MNTSYKIEKCFQRKHLYFPNTPFRSMRNPACEEGGGHRVVTLENVRQQKPDDCPMIGKDERYQKNNFKTEENEKV